MTDNVWLDMSEENVVLFGLTLSVVRKKLDQPHYFSSNEHFFFKIIDHWIKHIFYVKGLYMSTLYI